MLYKRPRSSNGDCQKRDSGSSPRVTVCEVNYIWSQREEGGRKEWSLSAALSWNIPARGGFVPRQARQSAPKILSTRCQDIPSASMCEDPFGCEEEYVRLARMSLLRILLFLVQFGRTQRVKSCKSSYWERGGKGIFPCIQLTLVFKRNWGR